jgi:hypothetical protein
MDKSAIAGSIFKVWRLIKFDGYDNTERKKAELDLVIRPLPPRLR